jgi:hypothetical protein
LTMKELTPKAVLVIRCPLGVIEKACETLYFLQKLVPILK